MMEQLVRLLHILEIPGSILGTKAESPEFFFVLFLSRFGKNPKQNS
jgi:hypothetical protein